MSEIQNTPKNILVLNVAIFPKFCTWTLLNTLSDMESNFLDSRVFRISVEELSSFFATGRMAPQIM